MNRCFRFLIAAVVAILLAPAARLHAGEREGEAPSLTVGRKVRFIAPEIGPDLRVGRIVAADDETLTVKVKGGPLRVRRDALASLDVSKRTSRWKQGALVGGVGLGALMWLDNDRSDIITGRDLAPVGAAFGLLTGAIVGAFIHDDHWQAVSPERLRVNVGPVPGRGVGASVALRF